MSLINISCDAAFIGAMTLCLIMGLGLLNNANMRKDLVEDNKALRLRIRQLQRRKR